MFKVEDRISAIKDALAITSDNRHKLTLFGASIEKSVAAPNDPVEWTFEEVCKRFDKNLMRMHKDGNTERGIIIFDKASYEQTIQNLAADFRTIGHTWGVVRNLSEVPLFLDSRASRLLQLADLITFAVKRAVENADFTFYDVVKGNFGLLWHNIWIYTEKFTWRVFGGAESNAFVDECNLAGHPVMRSYLTVFCVKEILSP